MISQDLLDILRCPACVSGPTRRPGDDPGRLQLVNDTWLVCQEEGCGRKYPIKDDIPVMLIEEGDKYVNTPVEALGGISLAPEQPAPQPAPVQAIQAKRAPRPAFQTRALAAILLITALGLWLLLKRTQKRAPVP
jgi:uncharacterized protein YbaR (Trm112 family)